MTEAKQILKEIQSKNVKPIYFLMGDEAFFIDAISDYIQSTVLQEHERDFNQTVVYGRDTSIAEIVATAKRFPMMSDYQVVIVKEAQELSRTIENLIDYADAPQASTILVICYKYKTLDKRKKLFKAISKNGVLLNSKKLYENQVPDWITKTLGVKGYAIEPKAAQMLVEFLGNDLNKINNELKKLQIILPKGTKITGQLVEENIGISKDFNVFELNKALSTKDKLKAYKICKYFTLNAKEKPVIMTIAMLFSYFSKVMQFHGLADKSDKNAASKLKISPFFVKDYSTAARHYSMKKVSYIIDKIKIADAKSKGLGASPLSQQDILQELLIHVFA